MTYKNPLRDRIVHKFTAFAFKFASPEYRGFVEHTSKLGIGELDKQAAAKTGVFSPPSPPGYITLSVNTAGGKEYFSSAPIQDEKPLPEGVLRSLRPVTRAITEVLERDFGPVPEELKEWKL